MARRSTKTKQAVEKAQKTCKASGGHELRQVDKTDPQLRCVKKGCDHAPNK